MARVLMIKFIHLDFQSKLSTFEFKNSPRNLINTWESQAISILEERGLDRSLEEISTLMKDDAVDLEVRNASKILFVDTVALRLIMPPERPFPIQTISGFAID